MNRSMSNLLNWLSLEAALFKQPFSKIADLGPTGSYCVWRFCYFNVYTGFSHFLHTEPQDYLWPCVVQREVGAKFCWSGVMKIYAGFFSLIIIIADTILSTVAALWVMAKRTKRNWRKLWTSNTQQINLFKARLKFNSKSDLSVTLTITVPNFGKVFWIWSTTKKWPKKLLRIESITYDSMTAFLFLKVLRN